MQPWALVTLGTDNDGSRAEDPIYTLHEDVNYEMGRFLKERFH
jgi:hypothetical protein